MTTIEDIHPVGFEWDESKNRTNVERHGLNFERASQVFESPIRQFEDDRRDYGEKRYRCVGIVDNELFAVIYTWRGGILRIISASRARRDERREYRQVFQG